MATSDDINANEKGIITIDNGCPNSSQIQWTSATGSAYSTLWICDNNVFPVGSNVILKHSEPVMVKEPNNAYVCENPFDQACRLDEATLAVLKNERDTIKELISFNKEGSFKTSESEEKWTKLNLALIEKTMDQQESRCEDEIQSIFLDLETIDVKRRSYYADQRSKLIVKNCLKRLE